MCILKTNTKLKICLIGIVLAIFIFGSVNMAYDLLNEKNITQEEEIVETIEENDKTEYVLNEEFIGNWYIEIPKIGLQAPIAEGTTQEVMSKDVGHFENTNVWEGNIGLAAHNRRMPSKLFWKN